MITFWYTTPTYLIRWSWEGDSDLSLDRLAIIEELVKNDKFSSIKPTYYKSQDLLRKRELFKCIINITLNQKNRELLSHS